jgi:hypothetical protein
MDNQGTTSLSWDSLRILWSIDVLLSVARSQTASLALWRAPLVSSWNTKENDTAPTKHSPIGYCTSFREINLTHHMDWNHWNVMPYRLWIIPPIWLAKLFLVRISDVISHRHGMRSNHEKRWSRQECDIFSHRNGLQVEHKGPYLPWKRSYETRSKSRRFWKEPWTYLKLQIVWKAVANNLAVSYSLVINCSKSSHCSMCDKSLNSAPLPHAKGNPNLLVMIFRKSVNFESQIATCDHRFHCDHPSRWPWMKWCSLRVSNRYAIDVINMGQLFDVVCYILFMCIYIYVVIV